jgi:biotin--protein ligase
MFKHLFYFIFLFPLLIQAETYVYVYNGPGVSTESFEQAFLALETSVGDRYTIKAIGPEEVIESRWEEKAVLFVMPGGADIPYCEFLNGRGNKKIRNFVVNGGAYLGICAGAYYGGGYVEFALGTDMEVAGERELSFFAGTVQGPVLAPYDYMTNSGSRAALINAFSKTYTIYFNGGGHFVDASKDPNVNLLATYDEGSAAIIECSIGQGKAILTGVHVEYDPYQLDASDPDYARIIPDLCEGDEERRKLFGYLLDRLIR